MAEALQLALEQGIGRLQELKIHEKLLSFRDECMSEDEARTIRSMEGTNLYKCRLEVLRNGFLELRNKHIIAVSDAADTAAVNRRLAAARTVRAVRAARAGGGAMSTLRSAIRSGHRFG